MRKLSFLMILILAMATWYWREPLLSAYEEWVISEYQREAKVDPSAIVVPIETEAVDALTDGNRAGVIAFLEEGGNPNAVNRHGDSLLMWAVSYQDKELVHLLLSRDADPHLTGTYGASPVHWAARKGYLSILDIFAKKKIDLDKANKEHQTPLMHAAQRNRLETTAFLLDHGVAPDTENHLGETALILAVREEAWSVIEPLVEAGADPEHRGGDSESALSLALKKNHEEVFFSAQITERYPDIRRRAESLLVDRPLNIGDRPILDLNHMAARIHSLVNVEREKRGLRLLKYDPDLATVAEAHSRHMAEEGFFAHVNPRGEDPTARAKKTGYRVVDVIDGLVKSGVGENIFQGFTHAAWTASIQDGARHITYQWLNTEDLALRAVEGWMGSPGHKDNILNANWYREGIGIFVSSDEKVYITQNFW